jgi:pyruvate dehydrogenase E2 component (dihydrolipoamide acetyltransferase)
MFEFKLPDIGEGLVEGEIVKWLISEGDSVLEDQPIVEVMTDKATVEISSPRDGVISKLLAKEGEVVAVDATFVLIDESGATTGQSKSETKEKNDGNGLAPVIEFRKRGDDEILIMPPIPSHRVLAAPAVRKHARQQGIDLRNVSGSGPYGCIVRQDLKLAASTPAVKAAPPAIVPVHSHAKQFVTRGGSIEEVPVRGLRKRIAEQMVRSKFTAPHFTYVEEVDMTAIVEWRKELKPKMQKRGVNVTFLPFIFKALIPAFEKYPIVNSSLDDDRSVLIMKRYFNFGISVATDDGLIVPVIKNADKLDAWQLASELARLSEAARKKKIKVEELQDSTFTITSVGNIGGVFATPIINHPEAAIMGVNKVRETVVVKDGAMTIRHMMYLSTSFDHRIVDGDVAANFIKEVVQQLENPKALAPELTK